MESSNQKPKHELKISLEPRSVAKFLGVCVLIGLLMFAAFTVGVSMTYEYANKKSYESALFDVQGFLEQAGYTFDWSYKGNGQYTFTITTPSGQAFQTNARVELHMEVIQRNFWGMEVSYSYHAMSLTNGGKDWIKENLFSGSGAVNSSLTANYIAVSPAADVFSASWTAIPVELTDADVARANLTYVTTGTGTFNLTHTFSITASHSTQLYGLYYDSYANAHNVTLVAAEQQGAGNVKNLVAGDSLIITIQGTVSYT